MKIETVKVSINGKCVIINACDFDKTIHKLFTEKKPKKESKPKKDLDKNKEVFDTDPVPQKTIVRKTRKRVNK